MPPNPQQPHPIDELLEHLTLEEQKDACYAATPTLGSGRLFGGLVAAMSLVAAGRTVAPDRPPHSLHGYFLRGGEVGVPIRFAVDRLRDGRSFSTRRVVAVQGDEAIFNLAASFATAEEGIAHQDPAPSAPPPDGLPDWEDLRVERLERPKMPHTRPVEVRTCNLDEFLAHDLPGEASRRVWLRPRGPLPADPLLHAAVLVYGSDRTLLSTAARPHERAFGSMMHASLDHAVWFHGVPRFDDWLLYTTVSPVARSARALIRGAIFDGAGVCIASVAQEGLLRTRRNRDGA